MQELNVFQRRTWSIENSVFNCPPTKYRRVNEIDSFVSGRRLRSSFTRYESLPVFLRWFLLGNSTPTDKRHFRPEMCYWKSFSFSLVCVVSFPPVRASVAATKRTVSLIRDTHMLLLTYTRLRIQTAGRKQALKILPCSTKYYILIVKCYAKRTCVHNRSIAK